MTTATAYDTLTTMFTANDEGLYEDFDIEAFAERLGITFSDAEDLLIDMENDEYIRDEFDGVYDAEKAEEYEAEAARVEAEEEAEHRRYLADIDAAWNARF